MATTYEKIASVTVGSGGAASMVFSSIPNTWDDLVVHVTARGASGGFTSVQIQPNGQTANRTGRNVSGSGSGVGSETLTRNDMGFWTPATATANTFSSNTVYIPNYKGSTNKSMSAEGVSENNGTEAYQFLVANLWSDTSAITSLTIIPGSGNFAEHSSATLYGIKKS